MIPDDTITMSDAAVHLDTSSYPYLEGLNPTQREAVELTEGPLLVLAGAGTGKTRVLTTRIAHIIAQGKAWPSEILAVTFTNKAAKEMKERITRIIGDQAEGLWIGTFHSIAAKMLRYHAELANLKPNFTILDTDDQLRLIKQIMAEHDIDEKKLPARKLLGILQRFKDRALLPHQLTESDIPTQAYANIRKLYEDYQARLQQLSAVDFGDLLLHVVTLLRNHPDILKTYQNRFRYMLVDEYQDTNIAQYLWLRLLAQGPNKNICCVGDDDQSIYGWRGAEVGNILRFSKDFEGASTVRLEQNYRSTTPILEAASAVIANNRGRLGKTLWTEDKGGEQVKVVGYENSFEESDRIADEISALSQIQGIRPKEMAVLVRAGYQTRSFESAFTAQGIAYRIVGGLRFYERKEIRDMIAYMRLMVNQSDDLAFERIINTPKRGVGDTSLQQIFKTASERRISLFKATKQLIEDKALRPKIVDEMLKFEDLLTRWFKMLETHHHAKVIETIAEESGYVSMLQEENTAEADARIDNIRELITALQDFENITHFLEHVSLVTDADETSNNPDNDDSHMVNVMTLHAAKGLEFNVVFLPGWEEGLFPSQKSMDESGSAGLEEERRLAYVGITRARKKLYISYAGSRQMYGQTQIAIPSRFLNELPDAHCEKTTRHRTYNAYGQGASVSPSPYRSMNATYSPRNEANSGIGGGSLMSASELLARRAGSTPSPASAPKKDGSFSVSDRVFHSKFGYGRIRSVDGNHLTVMFEKAGEKKVIDSFVTAQKE
ncbi:MAG: helicase [Rickettsiales bacterium]|jgi:DNA helicase-2/ATP-dependent DNA helicase PcrA|nr:helicase [Rickettsiales bacterium]